MDEEDVKAKNLLGHFYYLSIVIIGLGLLYLQVDIYRITFINIIIPISVCLIIGVLTFIPTRKHIKKLYPNLGNLFPLFVNIVSWGFIACYIFMEVNCLFINNNSKSYHFKIQEKGRLERFAGRGSTRHNGPPYIKFNYFGFEKQLVFSFYDDMHVINSDSVSIEVKKGGLGFEVIDKYDVF